LDAWSRTGNAGTTAGVNFLGTTDNVPLEIKVNGLRALRLEDWIDSSDSDLDPDGAPTLIGGSPANYVGAGVVGSTISGGGAMKYEGWTYPNWILSDYAVWAGAFTTGSRKTRSLPRSRGAIAITLIRTPLIVLSAEGTATTSRTLLLPQPSRGAVGIASVQEHTMA